MVWDESAGVVSHSFDEWKATDSEIRTYLALSLRWVQAAYDNAFGAAERAFSQHFDPDRDDPDGHLGYFEDEVAGLWPRDFFWMLRSGALRDAVTAFEVYAEKSILELLRWYRFEGTDGEAYRVAPTVGKNQMSPSWPTLRRIHEALGNDIEPAHVKYVLKLRHLLTHQRGELRTEEQRRHFQIEMSEEDAMVDGLYIGGDIPLGHERILEMMNDLAGAVRASDAAVWSHTWGGQGFPEAFYQLIDKRDAPLKYVAR